MSILSVVDLIKLKIKIAIEKAESSSLRRLRQKCCPDSSIITVVYIILQYLIDLWEVDTSEMLYKSKRESEMSA